MNPFLKRRKPPKPRKDREYKDGRTFKADKSELRREAFQRSEGRCEDEVIREGKITYQSFIARCNSPITWESMELSHKNHGCHRDDSLAGVLASCKDCHQKRHGSKCTYPRRAGKIMKAEKARKYWIGKICFCSTLEKEVEKAPETSFCEDCLAKLPPALRHDIENTQSGDYLITLAACETALMQWKVDNA